MTMPSFAWTTVVSDDFNRPDNPTTINPASDSGLYISKSGVAGIIGNKGYFPASADGSVIWREAWGTVQDVSVDHYRTGTYGSSVLILNWDRSSSSSAAFRLAFNSSASATIGRFSTEAVTLTPWTGSSTRLRMVSYYDPSDLKAHVLVYQDGVQVHEFMESGSILRTGFGFSTPTSYSSSFDETIDNLVVLTGRRTSGVQTVATATTERSAQFHPRPTAGFR